MPKIEENPHELSSCGKNAFPDQNPYSIGQLNQDALDRGLGYDCDCRHWALSIIEIVNPA